MHVCMYTHPYIHRYIHISIHTLQVQSICSSLAAGALEFGGHVWHTSDVAPSVVEYLPSTQLVHAASPVATLYLPATHCVQVSPSGPVQPGSQVQSICSSLAAGALEFGGHVWHTSDVAPSVVEYLPSTQLVHAASPVATLYLPATHCVQVSPSGPVQPGSHVHEVENELPAGESE